MAVSFQPFSLFFLFFSDVTIPFFLSLSFSPSPGGDDERGAEEGPPGLPLEVAFFGSNDLRSAAGLFVFLLGRRKRLPLLLLLSSSLLFALLLPGCCCRLCGGPPARGRDRALLFSLFSLTVLLLLLPRGRGRRQGGAPPFCRRRRCHSRCCRCRRAPFFLLFSLPLFLLLPASSPSSFPSQHIGVKALNRPVSPPFPPAAAAPSRGPPLLFGVGGVGRRPLRQKPLPFLELLAIGGGDEDLFVAVEVRLGLALPREPG